MLLHMNQQKIKARAEQSAYRCTSWQWEQSVGMSFWNTYFSQLGTGKILRGEDYRNHIKAQPTEVLPPPNWFNPMLAYFTFMWLMHFVFSLAVFEFVFSLYANYFGMLIVMCICYKYAHWEIYLQLRRWGRCLIISFGVGCLSLSYLFLSCPFWMSPANAPPHNRSGTGILMQFPIGTHFFFLFFWGLVRVGFCRESEDIGYVPVQDDELILLSGYCNVALPQVKLRFQSFMRFIRAAKGHVTSTVGRRLRRCIEGQARRLKAEWQLFEINFVWGCLANFYTHTWKPNITGPQHTKCGICEVTLISGVKVCYPVTTVVHPYFFHKECFLYSDLDQISRFIDPLDAIALMMKQPATIPPFQTMVHPQLVNPMEMIDWQNLEQQIA